MNLSYRSPISPTRYDTTLEYVVNMYDLMPYQRDEDLCNADSICLYSGHLIKYCYCNNEKDSFVIDNKDSQIEHLLQEQSKKQLEVTSESESISSPGQNPDSISDAQIQNLLEDSDGISNETPDGQSTEPDSDMSATGATAKDINLDDIEDW